MKISSDKMAASLILVILMTQASEMFGDLLYHRNDKALAAATYKQRRSELRYGTSHFVLQWQEDDGYNPVLWLYPKGRGHGLRFKAIQ